MSARLVRERQAAQVSTIFDARVKKYAGFYHEYPMLPAMLALADTATGGRDAGAYATQVLRHSNEIDRLELGILDDLRESRPSEDPLLQVLRNAAADCNIPLD